MNRLPTFLRGYWPQAVLTIVLLCFLSSNGQAQHQPIERVWSPSFSVEPRSVMGNESGWWITAGEQLSEDFRHRPVLLHWQPSADSFSVHRLWDDFTFTKHRNLSGDVSSLQKLPDGRIAASANYDLACDAIFRNAITNKAFVSSDSSSTLWQLNKKYSLKESYTFPSDTALVFADSLYVVAPNGQAVIRKVHSFSPAEHVAYRQNEVGIITEEGLSLYNQQGTQLHQNNSFDSLDATHWKGDTIAATEGDTLLLYDNSLQILAQKDLSAHFSNAPIVATWQDRLLIAGLNPQGTKWQVKAMTMNQQISDLVAFGDSSWVLRDMYVHDSVLGLTGVQQKRNSNALLLKTVHLPDTTQDRSLDVALTDVTIDNVSFQPFSQGLFNLQFDVYCKVQNNSAQDTINNLSAYLSFSGTPCAFPMGCVASRYHREFDSLMILPGESKMVLMDTIVDYCVSDSVTMDICPVVMAANQRVDSDMGNNSFCETLTAVGIDNPASSVDFEIYPTYVRDKITVEMEARADRATISIHDIKGRLIHRSKMTGNRQTIPLNAQPSGVYVATVSTADGKHSRKFMIGE